MYILTGGNKPQKEKIRSGLTRAGLKGPLECVGSGQGRNGLVSFFNRTGLIGKTLTNQILLQVNSPEDGSNPTPRSQAAVKPQRGRRGKEEQSLKKRRRKVVF